MMEAARSPCRILVADDDAISLGFLAAAATGLGCVVTAVASGGTALDACAAARFDLLLLDRRMPDCGGAALLLELRRRGVATTAIATSAELDASMRAELRSAGYVDALAKPIGLDALARTFAAHLSGRHDPRLQAAAIPAAPDAAAMLDDAAGLASVGGDHATLQALRGLLVGELETLRGRLAMKDPAGLADTLHRLRASSRYCGATALGDAAAHLETAIRTGDADTQSQFERFIATCARTLAALSMASC